MRAVAREHDRLAPLLALLQQRRRRLEQVHEREHVRVHGGVEVPLGGGRQRAEAAGGGVVHQDVEPAELPLHEPDHVLDVLLLPDVGPHAAGPAAERRDLRGDGVGLTAAGHEIDDDIGAGLGQPQGAGPADAPARAGHESHFAGQVDHASTVSRDWMIAAPTVAGVWLSCGVAARSVETATATT